MTPHDDFNFFRIANELSLHISEHFDDIPETPGAYMLFSAHGNFVYSGKASNLRNRIQAHFSASEPNLLIRILARYFVWRVTATEQEGAILEGSLYDLWLEATGTAPIANHNAPPESKLLFHKLAFERLKKLAAALNAR